MVHGDDRVIGVSSFYSKKTIYFVSGLTCKYAYTLCVSRGGDINIEGPFERCHGLHSTKCLPCPKASDLDSSWCLPKGSSRLPVLGALHLQGLRWENHMGGSHPNDPVVVSGEIECELSIEIGSLEDLEGSKA